MGDRDSIYGFASLGLEPFPLTDPAEAGKKVKDLAESGYAVIYITEALAAQIEPEINRYREAGLPAIIPVSYTHLLQPILIKKFVINVPNRSRRM